jgi:hypothetical protein
MTTRILKMTPPTAIGNAKIERRIAADNSGFAKAGVLCFFRKLCTIFVIRKYQESKC